MDDKGILNRKLVNSIMHETKELKVLYFTFLIKYEVFYILVVALFSCANTKSVQQIYPQYTITKIDILDDGEPIIYVVNDSESGIIINQDKSKLGKSISKIEIGKSYSLKLKKIDRNYRGQNDAFGVQSSKGTEKIIWKKEDGVPLVIYEAFNLSGTTLH